jgi:hypothetical protein
VNTGNRTVRLQTSWRLKTYTIDFKPGNYGKGTAFDMEKDHGVTKTLSSTKFTSTRAGYVQDGWSKRADGTTKDYS